MAAFNLGDVFVRFKSDTKLLKNGINESSSMLGRFGSGIKSAFGLVAKGAAIAGAAITTLIVANLSSAIKRVDTLNNSTRTFKNMGFAAKDVDKTMKALDKSLLGLPTSLDEGVRGVTKIAASINDLPKAQEVFSALNNAIIGFGGTTDMVSNAVTQLSQDLGTGRITAQTWLSLTNSGLTPALAAMAREMGITTKELKAGLSTGEISVDKFTKRLIELDKNGGGGMKSFQKIAKDATAGIGTGWQNMKTAITRGVAEIIQTIGSENISNAIAGFGKGVEALLKYLAPLIALLIQGLVVAFTEVGKWVQSVITRMGGLQGIMKSMQPVLDVFKSFWEVALLPALKEVWKAMQELWVELQKLWKIIGPVLMPVLKVLGLFLIGVLMAAIMAVVGVIWVIVTAIKNWVKAFNTFVDNTKRGILAWKEKWMEARRFIDNLIDRIKAGWRSLVSAIGSILGNVTAKITAPFKAAWDWIKTLPQKILNAFRNLKGTLRNVIGNIELPGPLGKVKDVIPGFAAGGFTGRGGMNEVAGIVHKGEYVVPKSQVDQNTGMPKAGGDTYNIHLKGVLARSTSDLRDLGYEIVKVIDQNQRANSKPQILGNNGMAS